MERLDSEPMLLWFILSTEQPFLPLSLQLGLRKMEANNVSMQGCIYGVTFVNPYFPMYYSKGRQPFELVGHIQS